MGRPAPDPDLVKRAWTLAVKHGCSARKIAQELGISATTAAAYVREGRDAEMYISLLDRAEQQQRMAVRLDFYTSWLVTAKEQGLTDPVEVVPVLLQVERERARLLGLYAPAKVAISDDREPHGPRPEILRAIRDAQAEAGRDETRILEGG